MRPDIRVTATKIRKFHATSVFNKKPEERQYVHDHMAHSGKTACAKYMRPDIAQRSTMAFRTLQQNLRGSSGESPEKEMEEPNKRKREEEEEEESDEEEGSGVLTEITRGTGEPKSITLTEEDRVLLRTLFKDEIQMNVTC